jgi:hypothetical protein
LILNDLNQLTDIPFKWGGTTTTGCDCLGLANLAREIGEREPVKGFGWVYDRYRSTVQLPEKTVEQELIALRWRSVTQPQNLDVLIMRGRFSLAIGTVWNGGALWFPGRFSAVELIEDCKSILGCYREAGSE